MKDDPCYDMAYTRRIESFYDTKQTITEIAFAVGVAPRLRDHSEWSRGPQNVNRHAIPGAVQPVEQPDLADRFSLGSAYLIGWER